MLAARNSSGRNTSTGRDRPIPHVDDCVEYNYAVAGHAGTMCDADGELFIKPCTQAEVDFYESAHASHPEMAEIMPLYIGTLSLNDSTDAEEIHSKIPNLVEHAEIPSPIKHEIQSHLHLDERQKEKDNVTWVPNKHRKIATDRAVVLDNASFGFKRPNIMDAKLGVRLWADDAPLQKKERFDKIAAQTTHKNYGFRVAGMRVYKGSDDSSQLDKEDYKIYDKDWGRCTVNDGNLIDSIGQFIFNEAAGIDKDLGKTIAGAFANDLRRVEEVLQNEETRMYSSSILCVFEGDGEALREAVRQKVEAARAATSRSPSTNERRSAARVIPFNTARIDSGIGLEEDEILKDLNAKGVVVHGIPEDADFEDFDDDDDDEFSSLPQIYTLKLIDFAHAKWTPGQGPDENSLLGIRSLAKIFEQLSE